MLRVLGQIVPREVVFVAFSEMVLGAIGTYVALQVVARTVAPPIVAPPGQLNLIFTLIITFSIAASILGLYRAETIVAVQSLLVKLLLAATLALLVTVVLPKAFGIEFGHSYDGGGSTAVIVIPLAWLGCLAATRAAFSLMLEKRLLVRRLLVIAPNDKFAHFADFIAGGSRCRRLDEICLIAADSEGQAELAERLKPEMLRRDRIWGVVVPAGHEQWLPASLLLELRLRGIRVITEATFWERAGCWIDVDGGDVSWVFDRDGFRHGRIGAAAKRVLDLVVAAGLIVLTLPLMLLTALLIKLDSDGPVLHRQERVGLHGRLFVLYKFRSMREDAEASGTPQWATIRDPRVTRVGRFIRYSRIDELPQLFNVLRGEMSVVGPRPERPFFVTQLAAKIPLYGQRHCVKPGITGWAQVNAPYGASLEDAQEKLCYDLYYVKNRNVLLDLWILACTVRVVLFQEGAR